MAFTWTEKKIRAAVLVAEDEKTNEQIATAVGVSRQALDKWKTDPEFQSRVHEHIEHLSSRLERYAIARKDKRVAALQSRQQALLEIVAERAADPSMQHIPGGKSGYLVRTYKSIGAGPLATVVEEYGADTSLVSALNTTEKQAAQEAGQWSEKSEQSVEITIRRYIGIDPEDV